MSPDLGHGTCLQVQGRYYGERRGGFPPMRPGLILSRRLPRCLSCPATSRRPVRKRRGHDDRSVVVAPVPCRLVGDTAGPFDRPGGPPKLTPTSSVVNVRRPQSQFRTSGRSHRPSKERHGRTPAKRGVVKHFRSAPAAGYLINWRAKAVRPCYSRKSGAIAHNWPEPGYPDSGKPDS